MGMDMVLLKRIKDNDPSLTFIDSFYDTRLNDCDALQMFEALANNTIITKLDLSGCWLGTENIKLLANMLRINNTLTELSISKTGVNDQGAQAIADTVETNKKLVSLNLSINQINDLGIIAIAEVLKINKTLARLNLRINQFTAIGAEALTDALETNKTLFSLNLSENPIEPLALLNLRKALAKNKDDMLARRRQFFQVLFVLALQKSNSLILGLPIKIMLDIINLIPFHSSDSIGKSTQQIQKCANFIFSHQNLRDPLIRAAQRKEGITLAEVDGRLCFYDKILSRPDDNNSNALNAGVSTKSLMVQSEAKTKKNTTSFLMFRLKEKIRKRFTSKGLQVD